MKNFFKFISTSLFIIVSLGASVGLTKTPVLAELCSNFTYLNNQDYAICAGAESWVFDGVTYAKCKKQNGTSASLPINYLAPSPQSSPVTPAGNVESVNQAGIQSKAYIVSTYNPPADLTTPGGSLALYTCNRSGSYAQCDGGICFQGTTGTNFPGVGAIASDEILCSCPIETTSKSYQVFGPSACPTTKADYDAICGSGKEANKNGKILMIGSPTNDAKLLAQCLNLHNNVSTTVTFNTCNRPR